MSSAVETYLWLSQYFKKVEERPEDTVEQQVEKEILISYIEKAMKKILSEIKNGK